MSYVQSAQVTNPDGVTDEAAHIVLSGDKKYFILEEIDRLENYVLSFWIKGKTAGKMILNYGDTDMEIDVTTDWQRVVFQFTAEWIDNIWIYFSGTEYYMYNTQLEIGNVVTDYSENPEEVKEKTNDKIEQYRKETQASIDLLSDSITLQVSALEEYVSTNYSTKRETEASIQLLSDRILSTVSEKYATIAYADEATEAAKQSAIQTAGDTLNQRLLSYSTTTQMNSAIDQKADSITQSVSKQITETKTYADTAATNAQNAANTATDNKLKSYSTTTQMNSAIDQKATGILSTVSQTYATNGKLDEANTKISQVEQTASKISWLVKSGTSASDFELTDRTATLVANYINLKGIVQFSGLDSDAQGKITTAESNASSAKSKVDSWASSSNTTLIDGAKIYTGSITADKISVTDLSALGATIAGWSIGTYAIYRSSATFGAANGMYFGTNGLSIGNIFSVDYNGILRSGIKQYSSSELNDGELVFYRNNNKISVFHSNTWEDTGTPGTGVESEYISKYIAFGHKNSSSDTRYAANLLINYGLNPDNCTQGIIAYSDFLFKGSIDVAGQFRAKAATNYFSGNLTIGQTTPINNEALYVNGTSYFNGNTRGYGEQNLLSGKLMIGKDEWPSYTLHVYGDSCITGNVYATAKLSVGTSDYSTNHSLYVDGASYFTGNISSVGSVNTMVGKLSVGTREYYTNYILRLGSIYDTTNRTYNSIFSDGNIYCKATITATNLGSGDYYSINYALYVSGSAYITGSAYVNSGTAVTSDRDLKYDIQDLDIQKTINFLKKLIPSSFIYKDNEFGRRHHGFIAQDLHEAMDGDDWGVYIDTSYDEPVPAQGENEAEVKPYKAIRYEEIIPDIVLALQQCLNKIENLENQLGGF